METGSSWTSILLMIVSAAGGAAVLSIGVLGTYLSKQLDHKLKMRALTAEINRYVQWTDSSKTFKLMTADEQIGVLLEQLQLFAQQNEILITDAQLMIMIESSIKPLMTLERSGKDLLSLK